MSYARRETAKWLGLIPFMKKTITCVVCTQYRREYLSSKRIEVLAEYQGSDVSPFLEPAMSTVTRLCVLVGLVLFFTPVCGLARGDPDNRGLAAAKPVAHHCPRRLAAVDYRELHFRGSAYVG